MEPSTAGAIFSCINSAIRFAELAVHLTEVGPENEVFIRMIQTVRRDVEETERLLSISSIRERLANTPRKLSWIKSSLHSARCCLNEIGKWVERPRVDQQSNGSIRFETRVRWVLNDHSKLINRKMELSTCHQQLLTVLNFLIPMEEASLTIDPPMYHDIVSFDDLISPRQRSRRRAQTLRSLGSISNISSISREEKLAGRYYPPHEITAKLLTICRHITQSYFNIWISKPS